MSLTEKYRSIYTMLGVLGIITFGALNYWFLKPGKGYTIQFNIATTMSPRTSTDSFITQRNRLQFLKRNESTETVESNNGTRLMSSNITTYLWKSDDRMIQIYGKVTAGGNYSVYSSTTHNRESVNYLFDLPLTALAWRRAGFNSIIILVVTSMDTVNKPLIKFMMSTLLGLDSVIVVLEVHPDQAVMISQVSRLFVQHLLNEHSIDDISKWDQTYLVTSDADLWPLKTTSHRLPPGIDIVSFNAYCCGTFVHKGQAYMMLPIGNIGMRVKTWLSVTRHHGFVPSDADSLVTYFSREFGEVAVTPVQKGANRGWFLDQSMISILIHDWASKDDNSHRVRYVGRDTGQDRIDRAFWRPFSIEGKTDSHILEVAYEQRTWQRVEALLVLMYDRPQVQWCQNYAKIFNTFLDEHAI